MPREPRQRARAHDAGLCAIGGDDPQLRERVGFAAIGAGEGLREVLETGLALGEPVGDGPRRPVRLAVRVAGVAGVRSSQLFGQVRARNAHRVVVARIDHHVGRRRHVAGRALRAAGSRRVVVMAGGVEFRGRVALRADRVARRPQLLAVRIVAIGAGDAVRVHPALQERAVVEDLVAHLPVGVIQTGLEQRRTKGVGEAPARGVLVAELAAPRMAARAGFDLARRLARLRAGRVAALRGRVPGDAATFVERGRQAFGRLQGLPVAVFSRPRHVAGTGPVTRFAIDVDVGPAGAERVRPLVEVLAQIRGMAVGALVVPVLVDRRPVQAVARPDLLAGIEVEPALAAGRARPRIPRGCRAPACGRRGNRSGTAAGARRRRCTRSRNRRAFRRVRRC